MLVDEWRSRLEEDHRPLRALSKKGLRAFGRKLQSTRSADWSDRMKDYLVRFGAKPSVAETCSETVLSGLDRWLEKGCEEELSSGQGVSPKIAAWAALYSSTEGSTPLGPLLRLDTLFHQQFNAAASLTQGTVVRAQDGASEHYLICTTPLCDVDRPEKIGRLYTFVRTRIVPTDQILQGGEAQNYCVVEHGGKYLCLAALIKERLSLEVREPGFDERGVVSATFSLGGDQETGSRGRDGIELHRVAQLRLDHALTLTATAAADASRIGVNKVELIRSRIGRGRPKKKAAKN